MNDVFCIRVTINTDCYSIVAKEERFKAIIAVNSLMILFYNLFL